MTVCDRFIDVTFGKFSENSRWPAQSSPLLLARPEMKLPAKALGSAALPGLQHRAVSLVAALFVATSPLSTLPASAATPPPKAEELAKLSAGLARVDYLLANWDEITTVCNGISAGGELEDAQVMRTQGQNKCFKTPLKVRSLAEARAAMLDS